MKTHSYKQITLNPKQHTVTVYTNKAKFSSVLTKIHSSKQITLNNKTAYKCKNVWSGNEVW